MKEITFRFEGTTPLLLHNNRSADPLDLYVKAKRPYFGKSAKKKTDEDHLAVSRLDWESGLYFDPEGYVSVPATNVEAMLERAGRRTRDGKKIKQGVRVDGLYCRLKFPDDKCRLEAIPATPDDVPCKSLDSLFAKYYDRRIAKPKGQGSVVRTRPRFDKWSITCTVLYDPEVIDERSLLEIVQAAGKYEGLGDYRERYGHFDPSVVK
jgi:hypothetical protein